MREIRMLRAMWRALETEPRRILNGHEGGNAGYSQGVAYGSPRRIQPRSCLRVTAPVLDPTRRVTVKRVRRKHRYRADKHDEAMITVLEQADELSAWWMA